jgi:hypothetical protein
MVNSITCKRCNQSGFHWVDNNGKWQLHDSKGNVHKCTGKKTTQHVTPHVTQQVKHNEHHEQPKRVESPKDNYEDFCKRYAPSKHFQIVCNKKGKQKLQQLWYEYGTSETVWKDVPVVKGNL